MQREKYHKFRFLVRQFTVWLGILGIFVFASSNGIHSTSVVHAASGTESQNWRLPSVAIDAQPSGFCGSVTDVPLNECLALEALYTNTGGSTWFNNSGWLTNTSVCSWYGVTCQAGHVSHLALIANNLNGSLPAEISNLAQLQILNLKENQLFGAIPPTIGNISTLVGLELSVNQLSGSIPAALGSLSNVSWFSLTHNQLSGGIPAELGNLAAAQVLRLNHNQLSGFIPPELGNLTNLYWIDLGHNQLTGAIPSEFGSLSNLTDLFLYENQLSGSLPAELGNLTKLVNVGLGYNQFSGTLPTELGNLALLEKLVLSDNNLTGTIPSQLGNLSNLDRLWLFNNQLDGLIPAAFGNLSSLEELILSSNLLSGTIPPELGNLNQLQILTLYDNQLSGEIPPVLGNLSALKILRLSQNYLTGSLPTELGNLISLEWLDLGGNQLTGEIPPALGNLTNLKDLFLYQNQLTGQIPTELASLTNLVNLGLDNNQLSGPIPPALGTFPQLAKVVLSGNRLTGPIPPQLGNLSNLDRLWLDDNLLEGPLPPAVGSLSNLQELKVNANNLAGELPDSLTQLTNLAQFWFDNTQLCEPRSAAFSTWLNTITDLHNTGIDCLISLSIGKNVQPAEVMPSVTATIELTVTAQAATTLFITDRLPIGLTYVQGSATGGFSYDATTRMLTHNGPTGTNVPMLFSYQVTVDSNNAPGAILDIPTVASGVDAKTANGNASLYIPKTAGVKTLMLIYIVADNDLGDDAIKLINNAEKATGIDPSVATVLLLDGPGNNNAYLYYLEPDQNNLNCPNYNNITCNGRYQFGHNLFEWGDNTASVSSLQSFIVQAQHAHPTAETVLLSLVGHGSGWSPELLAAQPRGISDQPRGISDQPDGGLLWDQSMEGDDTLSTTELRLALQQAEQETQKKIDLLYLDACSMAMTEVAYELTNSASYLLASESISWASFAYDKLLESVVDGLTPREIGERWLHLEADSLDRQLAEHGNIYPYTYSLVDLTQMAGVMEAHRSLTTELRNALHYEFSKETTAVALVDAANTATCFDSNYDGRISLDDTYCDLGSFAQNLQSNDSLSPEIVNAATSINTALNIAVVESRQKSGIPWYSVSTGWWDFSTQPLSGLSIYLPLSPRSDEVRRRFYSGSHLRYVAETNWDALLSDAWEGADPPTTTVDCNCAETIKPPSLLSTIQVEPMQTEVEPSEQITVNLELHNITIQQGFGSAELRLNYDATVLDAQSCTDTILLSSVTPSTPVIHECNLDTPGSIYLALAVQDGVISDTVLSQIGFSIIGAPGMASAIDITVEQLFDAYGNPMTLQPIGTEITVNNANAAHLPGDVDCNQTRNMQDAMGILHYVTGTFGLGNQCPPGLNTIYQPACDVSGNGPCDHTDALYIVQCSAQRNNPLCPGGVQSAEALLYATMSPAQNLSNIIKIGPAEQAPTGLWQVPVLATLDDVPLGATTVELSYDASQMSVVSCDVNPDSKFDIALCNPTYGTDNGNDGRIRISLVDGEGETGDVGIAQIWFRLVDDAHYVENSLSLLHVTATGPDGTTWVTNGAKLYLPAVVR